LWLSGYLWQKGCWQYFIILFCWVSANNIDVGPLVFSMIFFTGAFNYSILCTCWSFFVVSGLDKNLNSTLPFRQASLRICLPEPISHLPLFKKNFSCLLIINEAWTKISQRVSWVIAILLSISRYCSSG